MNPNSSLSFKSVVEHAKQKMAIEGFNPNNETAFMRFTKTVGEIEDRSPTLDEFKTLKAIFEGYLREVTDFLARSLEYVEKIRYDVATFQAIDEYGTAFINHRLAAKEFEIDEQASTFIAFQTLVKKAEFDYSVLRTLLTKAQVVAVV